MKMKGSTVVSTHYQKIFERILRCFQVPSRYLSYQYLQYTKVCSNEASNFFVNFTNESSIAGWSLTYQSVNGWTLKRVKAEKLRENYAYLQNLIGKIIYLLVISKSLSNVLNLSYE